MNEALPSESHWARVAPRLKDFQRRTVDHCFDRLFRDADRSQRVLIADEVGLGKTLVAKGLIARAVDHLSGTVGRVDIIYVCSNAGIARQNIQRLRLGEDADSCFMPATRPGLLPLELSGLAGKRISYISMTPGTGLEAGEGGGIARERALLGWLLMKKWPDLSETRIVNVLRLSAGAPRFRRDLSAVTLDADGGRIEAVLVEEILKGLTDGMRRRIDALCDEFPRQDSRVDEGTHESRAAVIAELRRLVGRTCLRSLRPDLVILDEFQRFKSLLADDGEESEVARELLNYADGEESVRVVLLSATPYKMYTQDHESAVEGGDDHYSDFLETMRFLTKAKERPERLKRVETTVAAWRRAIPKIADGDIESVARTRRELEDSLRPFMCRTERLAATADRSGMLRDIGGPKTALSADDVRRFLGLAAVAGACEQGESVEYWKSAPYALNFMDDYELKRGLRDRIAAKDASMTAALKQAASTLLTRGEVEKFERLDRGHWRLRSLVDHLESIGLFDRLWIPPTLPYWTKAATPTEARPGTVTKQLLFSSWKVVPKAVAALLNHEAQRRAREAIGIDGATDISGRLRLDVDEHGNPTGQAVMALTYPSVALATLVDPAEWSGREIDVSGARELAGRALEPSVSAMIARRCDPNRNEIDERWYWAAPILLDRQIRNGLDEQIFGDRRFGELWKLDEGDEPGGTSTAAGRARAVGGTEVVSRHASDLRWAATGGGGFGAPPADLIDVLVDMALGHPAVVALRAFARSTGDIAAARDLDLRFAAMTAAVAFRSLFNLAHAAAIVERFAPGRPYWRFVLAYGVNFELAAVLDEHVHMMVESLSLRSRMSLWSSGGSEWTETTKELGKALATTIFLRATTVRFDAFKVGERGAVKIDQVPISGHFASRFTEEKEDENPGNVRLRQDALRLAFNGPFFPFVLATTSVGQEGLDFHTFCHSVVHWNLPSNPVDLEQREGRVHRFKNHAVRKNVVRRFGPAAAGHLATDKWDSVFATAEGARGAGESEMFPFWVCADADGSAIERRVLSLPMSRDIARHDALIRSLAVYRLVFGQPRQEELMRYLASRVPEGELQRLAGDLRVNLEPAK